MDDTVEFTLPEFPNQTFRAHRYAHFFQFGEVYPPEVYYQHQYNNGSNNDSNNGGNNGMNINNSNGNYGPPPVRRPRLHGGNVIEILHPVGVPSMTEHEISQYYRAVEERAITDDNILPGDVVYQSVFYESEESSGIQRTEGICIVDLNYEGNKVLTPIYQADESTHSLFHTLLRQINPDFFRDADIALSNLLGFTHPPNTLRDIAMRAADFMNQAGGKRRRSAYKKKSLARRRKTRKSKKRSGRKTHKRK